MPVRGSRSHRQPEPSSASGARSYAVIAGSPRSGKTALLNALIRRADPVPAGDAWLVYRHGDKPETHAFVPGHREPRTVVGAFVPTQRDPRPGPTRPARRIEITHPASLLKRVALVDTPGSGGLDAANAEIILDAAERGLGLLFVVDAAAPCRAPTSTCSPPPSTGSSGSRSC